MFGIQPRDGGVPFCVVDAGASRGGARLRHPARARRRTRPRRGSSGWSSTSGPRRSRGSGASGSSTGSPTGCARRARPRCALAGLPSSARPRRSRSAGAEDLLVPSPEGRANAWALKDLLRPSARGGPSATVAEPLSLVGLDGVPVVVHARDRSRSAEQRARAWFRDGVEVVLEPAPRARWPRSGASRIRTRGSRILLGGRARDEPALRGAARRRAAGGRAGAPLQGAGQGQPGRAHREDGGRARRARRSGSIGSGRALRAEKRDAVPLPRRARPPRAARRRPRSVRRLRRLAGDGRLLEARRRGPVHGAPTTRARSRRTIRACAAPVCALGRGAVGQRLYVRAVGPARAEVSVGPPGGEPASGAVCWTVHLESGAAEKTGG